MYFYDFFSNYIKHPLKERRCKFKIDKINYSKRSVEECITLPKISLQCIVNIAVLAVFL